MYYCTSKQWQLLLDTFGKGWSREIDVACGEYVDPNSHAKFIFENNLLDKTLDEIIILWKLHNG